MPVQRLPLLVLPPPMKIMMMADDSDDVNDSDFDNEDDQGVIYG